MERKGRGESGVPMAGAMRWVHRVTGLGSEIIVPTLIGWYVDERFHTRPWGIVGGAMLGIWLAGISLIALIRDLEREMAENPRGDSGQEWRDR
ncbi:MAG: AtpZ/AtpI family protein [Planctomycetia bacterium]|nr:AtpZ/AtpI family protein [Planctomycetia bacterium]